MTHSCTCRFTTMATTNRTQSPRQLRLRISSRTTRTAARAGSTSRQRPWSVPTSPPSTEPGSRRRIGGAAYRASDRFDEPAESFRDEIGIRQVAALFIDDDLSVGHVVSEPLAMLGRHEHVVQAVKD